MTTESHSWSPGTFWTPVWLMWPYRVYAGGDEKSPEVWWPDDWPVERRAAWSGYR